jgi:nucleotide-binding universal stress UspA family protein
MGTSRVTDVPDEPEPESRDPPNESPPFFRSTLLALDLRQRPAPGGRSVWDFLRSAGGKLTICHVVMRPTSVAGNELDGAPANAEETAIVRDLRSTATAELGVRGRDVPIKILHGDAGQRICEYAEYVDCDLVVLGPRQKGTLAKALKGSVSRYVVANCKRNVLVLGS